MATWKGSIQSPIVTQRYLNTAAWAGDPAPGAIVSTADVSGSIVQDYAGMIGGILTLNEKDAKYYRDPASAALYAGDYQYVKFYASSSAAAAVQGQVVFWQTLLNDEWTVTPDYSSAKSGQIAGIALCNTAKGKYWFIQIAGVAEVKFAASLGASTPAVGDLVFVDYSADTFYGYVPLQSKNDFTAEELKQVLGVAWGTIPAAGVVSPVLLGGLSGAKYYPGG
jgi:hypothetical protein